LGEAKQQGIEWKSIEELKEVTLFPKDIINFIEKDMKNNFQDNIIYLPADVDL